MNCVVCKGPALERSKYCHRCRRSVRHRDLRGDGGGVGPGGFGCRCTGVVLADPWSPWSLDRRDPRRRRVVGEGDEDRLGWG